MQKKLRSLYQVFSFYITVTICCLLLITPFSSRSQTNREKGLPFITNYSPKTFNALPQTWCAQEDDRGMKYFGIQEFLLEYDGVSFRKVKIAGNARLPVIRSMAKSKEGVIYYGAFGEIGYIDIDSLGQTKTNSLLQYIPAANRVFFDVWSTYTTENSVYFQSREFIFRIAQHTTGKNGNRAVKVWKPQTNFMYSFYLDGTYYVHQKGLGLYKMINDSLVLIPGSEFLGKERVQVMLPYPDGIKGEKQYLLGMFYGGLFLFNGETFQPFKTDIDPIFKSGNLLYKGLQLQNRNYVLATTGKGVQIIDAHGKLLQKITREVGLQDESIYGIFEDRKGTLWLTMDNGISRVETSSPLTKFGLQSGINTGVTYIKRFEGNLYVGTTNGLLKFNNSNSIFEPVAGIPQTQVFSFTPDGNQLLVPGDGLFAIKNNKTFTIRESVSGDMTVSALLIPDKHPSILFAALSFGVAVFDRNSPTTTGSKTNDWHYVGNIPGITEQTWTIKENKDGSIWVGTQNGVAYRIILAVDEKGNPDLKRISFKKYGAESGYKNGLGQCYSIKGITYFIADSSLYTFDDTKKLFVVDSTFGNFKNGGGLNEFDMVEDHKGRVWIRFGKQTRLATPKPGGGYTFDDTQLSSIAEFTIQKIYPEDNGIVWVCTTDGLIRFDESLEKNHDQSFQSILRQVSTGKVAVDINSNDSLKYRTVSYKNNTLRFEYAAPFFEQEEKTTYQTWLEGFEKEWSELDKNYYKEYTNLPAGKYTFHVRAENIYKKISEEAIYNFEILPPWYQTWWAYLLYAIVLIGSIYIIIHRRTQKLKDQHRELEKIVAERTHEISQRVEELGVINAVQDGLVREIDIQGIYNLVGEKIREIFNAQVIDIVTYNNKTNLIEDRYAYEKGDRSLLGPREPEGFRKHLIENKQLILINKDIEKLGIEYDNKVLIGSIPKSAVFVPMISAGEVVGIISLQDLDKEDTFTQADVSLVTTLANSMSVALESARRFDETNRLLKETEQRTAELAVINSVQDGLAKELDMQAIYDLVGERLGHVFNTQVMIIATLNQETKTEHFNYIMEKGERFSPKPRPYDKLREHLVESRQKILINTKYEEAAAKFGMAVMPGTAYPKSLLFVPLIVGDKVKSYVSLQNIDNENAFSEADVRLLETLANSMSVALENARLFAETTRLLKETEQRTAELAVINSVQDGLAKELDIQGIYNLVGDRVQHLFQTHAVIIASFDLAKKMEHFNYVFENGEKYNLDSRPINHLRKILIEKKKTIYVETEDSAKTEYGITAIGDTVMPKSLMFVPLLGAGNVKGYISIQNIEKENAFTATDIRLLETLANSMSVALENARLFDETNRLLDESTQQANELSTVNNVSQALASQLNIDEIIKLVGDQMKDLFKANIVYIALLDKKINLIHFPYQFGDNMPSQKMGEGLTSKILQSGKPLLINKDVDTITYKLGVSRLGVPAASYLGVPIPSGEEIIGVLSIQSTESENRFNENNERLLLTIAASVGVALNKAQLFDEVISAKQQAEEASKAAEKANEAKSAFLSTVSHELRTPLTSVLGFAKIIRKRLVEKIFPIVDITDPKIEKTIGQISENLQVVISEGERLTHLINDVLDLAKIEAGKMDWSQENVQLTEVIERAIAATTYLFDQKNLQLIREIDPDLPEITGDHDKLIQVVINLISNSIKFTDKGSITCRLKKKGAEIIVSIIDTGIGIKPADFGAVFEQFKQVGGDTLTDKPKGTGLGLPICKEIVEHLGGRIWLESEVGKGSIFSFALPFTKSSAVNEKPIHLNELVKQLKEQMLFSKLKVHGENSTILIVDDDESIRSLLRQELTEAGYLTEEAMNGKEALECIRKSKPDLIILDVMMPEINGFDVAAILKNDPQTMDIPIIILSVIQDKARGFRIGVDRYLNKPIDTVQLFAEVGALLEQGKSKKKVMVVDEDSFAVKTLTDVLKAKGYSVVESDGKELVQKAIANLPDVIILNSILTDKSEIVQTLRFEKGLENVLFFIYQ